MVDPGDAQSLNTMTVIGPNPFDRNHGRLRVQDNAGALRQINADQAQAFSLCD
jgi:hypothetical protein